MIYVFLGDLFADDCIGVRKKVFAQNRVFAKNFGQAYCTSYSGQMMYLLQDGKLELNMVYASCRDDELERMSEQEKAELETHFQCSLYSDFDIALEDIFSGLLP